MGAGTVKWFDAISGVGAVVPDDGGREVLIHSLTVIDTDPGTVRSGQQVIFELAENSRLVRSIRLQGATPAK